MKLVVKLKLCVNDFWKFTHLFEKGEQKSWVQEIQHPPFEQKVFITVMEKFAVFLKTATQSGEKSKLKKPPNYNVRPIE